MSPMPILSKFFAILEKVPNRDINAGTLCETLRTKYKHLSLFDLSPLQKKELVDYSTLQRFHNSFALRTVSPIPF